MLNAQDSDTLAFLRAQVDERDRHLETLLQRDAERREELKRLAEAKASLEAEVARLGAELAQARDGWRAAERLLDEIFGSKAWRWITLLRRIKAWLPRWR